MLVQYFDFIKFCCFSGRWTGVFVMAQGTISAVIVTTVTSAIVAFILLYSDFR